MRTGLNRPCERVSVRGDKICRERVCASQRRGGILPPQSADSRGRDRRLRSSLRECRGKPGVFPETARNRLNARLRGGARRTQPDNQPVMDPMAFRSTASPDARSDNWPAGLRSSALASLRRFAMRHNGPGRVGPGRVVAGVLWKRTRALYKQVRHIPALQIDVDCAVARIGPNDGAATQTRSGRR